MPAIQRVVLVVMSMLCSTGIMAGPAAAHEPRPVGGFRFQVGWAEEPALTGVINAVQLALYDAAGRPVQDLGQALTVEVTFGSASSGALPLLPVARSPGEYRAPIIPTRPGEYAFRFTGTVRGQKVDQRFMSSPQTFDPVRDLSELEFPVKDPPRAELAGRLERITARVDAARERADRANTAVRLAVILGVLGLLVGSAGVVLGLRSARRSPVA